MTMESLELTPAGEEKKSYVRTGFLSNVMQSIWVRIMLHAILEPFIIYTEQQTGPIKNPSLIGKQGKLSQLGGDFIFGPGLFGHL
jgi:hypothetical protein